MTTILMRRRWRCINQSVLKKFPLRKLLYIGRQKGKAKGPSQDQVAIDIGKRNQGDGEGLGRHQGYGKGSTDVEGMRCSLTCHLGVKGMSA